MNSIAIPALDSVHYLLATDTSFFLLFLSFSHISFWFPCPFFAIFLEIIFHAHELCTTHTERRHHTYKYFRFKSFFVTHTHTRTYIAIYFFDSKFSLYYMWVCICYIFTWRSRIVNFFFFFISFLFCSFVHWLCCLIYWMYTEIFIRTHTQSW